MSSSDGDSIGRKMGIMVCTLIPALLSTSAFACAMIFGFWCESIKFKATEPLISGIQRDDLHFGPWYQLHVTVDQVQVGAEYVQVKTSSRCEDWELAPDIDSKWRTARAFTIITAILGGFLTIPLWFAPCLAGRISNNTWCLAALMFTVVLTLFQGLTFLIFKSNACSENVSIDDFRFRFNSFFYEDECSWDSGSTANVIAVVFWFLTGAMMIRSGPPLVPEPVPPTTQTVTYQQTVSGDGANQVAETNVTKGKPLPLAEVTKL